MSRKKNGVASRPTRGIRTLAIRKDAADSPANVATVQTQSHPRIGRTRIRSRMSWIREEPASRALSTRAPANIGANTRSPTLRK